MEGAEKLDHTSSSLHSSAYDSDIGNDPLTPRERAPSDAFPPELTTPFMSPDRADATAHRADASSIRSTPAGSTYHGREPEAVDDSDDEKDVPSLPPNRLILVSNRLPVTVKIDDEGNISKSSSSGGLATGLAGPHQNSNGLWIGWPGDVSSLGEEEKSTLDAELAEMNFAPVHLTPDQVYGFYTSFSNGVLWPLFHYLLDKVQLESKSWTEYKAVNQLFADEVCKHIREGDLIWVHDYQLCLVPEMVRKEHPRAKIGFFLHIPFPSSEVFRILPWRNEVLRGLLGADIIGFHSPSYVRHFGSSLQRTLGFYADVDRLFVDGREVEISAFPMGIDAQEFIELESPVEDIDEVNALKALPGVRMLLGVDRLDYTKGIEQRLQAIERLLESNDELRGNLLYVQVAVPSREDNEMYQVVRHNVDELVGRLNGQHSTIGFVPVRYLYQSVSKEKLVALYRAADCLLVTPLRDGMNLVAKEFIAARNDQRGVLVLSEFAGAAQELADAVTCNPYDVEDIAKAIQTGLDMPVDEQEERMMMMRKTVKKNTVHRWAAEFIHKLNQVPALSVIATLKPAQITELAGDVKAKPLVSIIMDYDGTLVPFRLDPKRARPSQHLLSVLQALAQRPNVAVHIISSRSPQTLQAWLGHLPISLHAEDGLFSLNRTTREWDENVEVQHEWKERVLPLVELFVERTPGARVEVKNVSLSFHYEKADPVFGAMQAKELRLHLHEVLCNLPVVVLPGKKAVQIRYHNVHKGMAIPSILSGYHEDDKFLMLAIGDDKSDEDLFAALPEDGRSLSIHVGTSSSTRADYRLEDVPAVLSFLKQVAD